MIRATSSALFLMVLLVPMLTTPALSQTGDPCTSSGSITTVTFPGGSATLYVDANGELKLKWSGGDDPCGSTNTGTAAAFVNGTTADDSFFVDQGGPGGGFNPNLRFVVDMKEGKDSFCILGTNAKDNIHYATLQQSGGTFDVFSYQANRSPNGDLFNTESLAGHGLGGNDRLWAGFEEQYRPTAQAGTQTGPARLPITFEGSSGNDSLVGGTANDTLLGGSGNDSLDGEGGKDKLVGGKGEDGCEGGPGKDTIKSCEKD